MIRLLVRSTLLVASLSAVASSAALAQTEGAPWSRIILAPQVGAVVDHSRGAEVNVLASVVGEMPVGRGISVAAEWTRPYGGYAIRVCPSLPSHECFVGAELRSSGSLGVMVRPVRLGSLEPYAGISAGAVRWAYEYESGVAPMATARAGLDVHVIGPVGLRGDLVRRWAWTETPGASPIHTDMFSIGARVAIRR